MDDFTREELQMICLRATEKAKAVKNINWINAYGDLAAAADCLDAMEARTEDKG